MNHELQTQSVRHALTDRYVAPAEAAALLGVGIRVLEDWRLRGRGPRYRKFGRLVRYSLGDLIEYADGAIVEPSRSREEVCA